MDFATKLRLEREALLGGAPVTEQPTRELNIDSGASLKVNDLVNNYEYLNPIREYMVERKGVDYKDKKAEEVVDDFVQHMRYFNANSVSTAGEVRFVSKANEQQKEKTKKAYQIYDALGNVFVNDGVMGAVSGIGDYVSAAAKDPTNYLGLVTGGVARVGAGVSLTGKKLVRNAVMAAGKESLKSGADRYTARLAAARAGREAAKRAVQQGMSKKQADGVYLRTAKEVQKEGRDALARAAMKRKQQELFETAATRSLKQTVALDAGAAVLNDVMVQTAQMRAGSQESYSALQTGFSSLLGGVAGGAQLVFGKAKGMSGLAEEVDVEGTLTKIANRAIELHTPKFTKAETDEIAKETVKNIRTWEQKVAAGREQDIQTTPELIKYIMLGDDGFGGIASFYKEKDIRLAEKRISLMS